MNKKQISIIAFAAGIIIAIAAMFDAGVARAQGDIRVDNRTGCSVILCFYNSAGDVLCFGSPANMITQVTLPGTFGAIGIQSAGGINYPFVPTPPILVLGCTSCITLPGLGSNPPCCGARVCYDQATATVRIIACGPPCDP